MDRANECLVAIAERLTQLIDQIVKIRFFHERFRPQAIVEFLLRNGFGSRFDEDLQKLKCFSRKMHRDATARQLVAIGIKGEIVKTNAHLRNGSRPNAAARSRS
jgi:hypothetical protein